MGRAVVFSDENVLGIRVRGEVVVSYPRKIWEPTRVEDGTRYWSSRERTSLELFELTSQLHTKAEKINRAGKSPPGSARAPHLPQESCLALGG
jgi:hypothetical protein